MKRAYGNRPEHGKGTGKGAVKAEQTPCGRRLFSSLYEDNDGAYYGGILKDVGEIPKEQLEIEA